MREQLSIYAYAAVKITGVDDPNAVMVALGEDTVYHMSIADARKASNLLDRAASEAEANLEKFDSKGLG